MKSTRNEKTETGQKKTSWWPISLIAAICMAIPSIAAADETIYNTAIGIIDRLGAEDAGEMVHYNSTALIAQEFTTDKETLKSVTSSSSATAKAIYDGIYGGVSDTALQNGQRAVVVIADGIDNASNHSPSEVIAHAQINQVPVFIIGIGTSLDSTTLQLIASETGGEYYTVTASEIDTACQAIDSQLDANQLPTISGTPSINVAEGNLYEFSPIGRDDDVGDNLTFHIINKPSWAQFDSTSGRLWGTPGEGDVGTYGNIQISVADSRGGLDSLGEFAITVENIINPPRAYTISAMEGTLRGVVNPDGTNTVYNFEYWPEGGSKSTTTMAGAGSGTLDVSVQQGVSGLAPGTRYRYRIIATNSEGTTYGNEITFETEPLAGNPDPVEADTVYVEMNGFCGWQSPCYLLIQNGVDDAITGEVVKVAEGTYEETVIIDKDVTIEIGWNEDFTSTFSAGPVVIGGSTI